MPEIRGAFAFRAGDSTMIDYASSAAGTADESRFDLDEFNAIRQEILLRVEATFKLEIVAVTGAAAVYAWLGTRTSGPKDSLLWFLPVVVSLLGWLRAETLGHQAYSAGTYLLYLERRLRPRELEKIRETSIEPAVHGWEGYIRLPRIRRWYIDHVSRIFWGVFLLASLVLAIRGCSRG